MSDRPPSVVGMIIDCGSCVVAGPACDDCVVSVLLGLPEVRLSTEGGLNPAPRPLTDNGAVPPPHEPLHDVSYELPDEHAAAVAVLADSGLVPPLRLIPGARAS